MSVGAEPGDMKILVVDDEQSFGALLGHTLRRLGHKPVLALDPRDALEMLSADVEAVITDIDMPGMSGIQLACEIRRRRSDVPIAFCTGSAPEGDDVRAAAQIGRVLPKVWTVADVRAVVDELGRRRRRRPRRSTMSHVYAEVPRDHSPPPRASAPAPTTPAPRLARSTPGSVRPPRVRVTFRRWSQVMRLCDDSRRGPVYASVPGALDLAPGREVALQLALPDEITVKIPGEIHASRPTTGASQPEIVIELAGLTDDVARRLRSLAIASEPALAGDGAHLAAAEASYLESPQQVASAPVAGTPSPERWAQGSERTLRVSELLIDNDRLRQQIERLPGRLQRSTSPMPELQVGYDEEEDEHS
jgi:CheY-like chemotaxis protein